MKATKLISLIALLISITLLTGCSQNTKDNKSTYGIASPIKSITWGMNLEDCQQALPDSTFELIDNTNSIMYKLTPHTSVLGYTDEINQIILKFDQSSTESYFPYHCETLSSIQVIFTNMDIEKMKKQITKLVGCDGKEWVDIKKNNFITWESKDTIDKLDKNSSTLLDNFWKLLETNSNTEVTIHNDSSEAINHITMQYTNNNTCSVEFFGGLNTILYQLK